MKWQLSPFSHSTPFRPTPLSSKLPNLQISQEGYILNTWQLVNKEGRREKYTDEAKFV